MKVYLAVTSVVVVSFAGSSEPAGQQAREKPSASAANLVSSAGPNDGPGLQAATGCPAGARCISVDQRGAPNPNGPFTAQCSGRFPDFIDTVPPGYADSRFVLAQDYPAQLPAQQSRPWKGKPFKTPAGADEYLAAVRAYIYKGMVPANWVAQANTVEQWFHVPWMTAGNNPRELARGVTGERTIPRNSQERVQLRLKPDVEIRNVAIGYYNSVGGYTIGKVWANAETPDPTATQFEEGTVVAKVLFTTATCDDFLTPEDCPFDDATPVWKAHVPRTSPSLAEVRLLQMDIAVKDSDATPTGWIFGTFAYDKSLSGSGWERMGPVGLMWGDDPTLVPDGGTPVEGIISAQVPAYAGRHLGWASRLNGPVDNPVSSCLSCHGTAQTPVLADITPSPGCRTLKQKLWWFRDLTGNQAFGHVDKGSDGGGCTFDGVTPSVPLDFSLQLHTAFRNVLLVDPAGAPAFVNPCAPALVAARPMAPGKAAKTAKQKRVLRAQTRYNIGR